MQPAISAGPAFWPTAARAKLKAGKVATTPTGSLTTRLLPAIGMMLPPSEPPASGVNSLILTSSRSSVLAISAL